MDTYEATKVVMSRIQSLDPENASKIMGYILIQDQGEKEMIRLAFGPENHLLSYINKAKAYLGRSSSSINNPSSTPFLHSSSPRILIPNNGFHHFGTSNPSSPASAANPFARTSPRPISYASVLNNNSTNNSCGANSDTNTGQGSSSLNFYGGNEFGDEFFSQDQLPFLDDSIVQDPIMSPSGRSDSLVFPYGEDANGVHPQHHPFHRRSCSVNDVGYLSNMEEMGGFGWRPCMYFARGFCKNGAACKFLHSDEGIEVGSPNNSGFDELLRMKALQQQRFALMASGGSNPFAHSKCMNFLNENLR